MVGRKQHVSYIGKWVNIWSIRTMEGRASNKPVGVNSSYTLPTADPLQGPLSSSPLTSVHLPFLELTTTGLLLATFHPSNSSDWPDFLQLLHIIEHTLFPTLQHPCDPHCHHENGGSTLLGKFRTHIDHMAYTPTRRPLTKHTRTHALQLYTATYSMLHWNVGTYVQRNTVWHPRR
jgi:hypothetical protein